MTELSRLRGSEGYAVRANPQAYKLKAAGFQFERRRKGANAVFGNSRRLLPETELSGLCVIPQHKTEAQRSGFGFERRRKGANAVFGISPRLLPKT